MTTPKVLKVNDLEIVTDKPFENDVLGRKESAEALTQFISTANEPLVLCLNAAWGRGKTTFLRMWNQHLLNEGFPTIFYNAWENDFTDDPLVSLLGEIGSAVSKMKRDSVDDVMQTFNDLTADAALFRTGKNIFVNIVKKTTGQDLNEIAENLKPLLDSGVEQVLENNLRTEVEQYQRSKKSQKEFRQTLEKIVEVLSNDTKAKTEISNEEPIKPLIFIIDELDRCRPTFAIELLEKAKHFFNLRNIIFILGADKEQLGSSMKAVYGDGLNVSEYLRKFIDFDYELPRPEKSAYLKALFRTFNLDELIDDEKVSNEVLNTFTFLIRHYQLGLRKQERCLGLLNLAFRSNKSVVIKQRVSYLSLLIVIKINEEQNYKKLHSKEVSQVTFFNSPPHFEVLSEIDAISAAIKITVQKSVDALRSRVLGAGNRSRSALDRLMVEYLAPEAHTDEWVPKDSAELFDSIELAGLFVAK